MVVSIHSSLCAFVGEKMVDDSNFSRDFEKYLMLR